MDDLEKLVPHFETEEEALEYAKRLTQLKAGDEVLLPNKAGDGLQKEIFTGTFDNGDPTFLEYSPERKRLIIQTTPLFTVTLP